MKKRTVALIILCTILTVVILFIGFKAIFIPGPPKISDEMKLQKFQKDISHYINEHTEYKRRRSDILQIPKEYNEICFENKSIQININNQENINLNLTNLRVNDYFCLEPENGQIQLNFEGYGSYCLVSPLE